MAFFKKTYKPVSELWYPESILVGKPVTTDEIARRLARESTVSRVDVKAVLEGLSGLLGEYMAQGRSVKLDGIGSFFFQSVAKGKGVKSPEEVTANLISSVKVRFIPETSYRPAAGRSKRSRWTIRAMTDVNIEWVDISTLVNASERPSDRADEAGADVVQSSNGEG